MAGASSGLPSDFTDPVAMTEALIRCPSVTPADGGALDLVSSALTGLGFEVERLDFGGGGRPLIGNLYARLGTARPNLCFAGHTDVVPVGDLTRWTHGPFEAATEDGQIYGRGACDMKSAIAAFVAAVARHRQAGAPLPGSISLLITGDEEGPSIDGTRAVVDALSARGEHIDHALVGEPTSKDTVGDTIKIGRRGSLTVRLTVVGVQGHVAYPQDADNPLPVLARLAERLSAHELDRGLPAFDPSNLEIIDFHVGNDTTNLIPAKGRLTFNVRFNPLWTGEKLIGHLKRVVGELLDRPDRTLEWDVHISSEPFLTEGGAFTGVVARAIEAVTGTKPHLSTGGGTSDARFLKTICPVLEAGLVGRTMHQVDERVAVADIEQLTQVYQSLISAYFAKFAQSTGDARGRSNADG
ncbi:MAG: succinyl-diaminopimelate desuccinylase [Pseudomonadota bacterium]